MFSNQKLFLVNHFALAAKRAGIALPELSVMFVYHYLPALCIALLGLGHLIDRSGRDARWLAPALIALAAAGFVYFAPLTYGLTLTHAEFDARMWLRGWR